MTEFVTADAATLNKLITQISIVKVRVHKSSVYLTVSKEEAFRFVALTGGHITYAMSWDILFMEGKNED